MMIRVKIVTVSLKKKERGHGLTLQKVKKILHGVEKKKSGQMHHRLHHFR